MTQPASQPSAVFVSGTATAVPPRIDFFGLHRERSAFPGLDPLIKRAADQTGQMEAVGGPTAATAASFLSALKLPRVDTFAKFVREFAEQSRASRSVCVPGVTEAVLQPFLPDEYEDRGSFPLFGKLRHFFSRGWLRDPISLPEVGFFRALFQLVRLDWDGIDEWGGQDGNLQQLSVYFLELFHGRFRDRSGTRIAFENPLNGLDAADISPATAGKLFAVLVEYIGDKLFRVPIGHADAADLKSFTCHKAGVITARIEGVKLNGTGADYSDLVTAVVTYTARRAEKATRAAVGGLIRGGGLAAINNEVVAEVIATTSSGLAKKSAERLTYGVLTGYITDPAVGGTPAQKTLILDWLKHLHLKDSPAPPTAVPV